MAGEQLVAGDKAARQVATLEHGLREQVAALSRDLAAARQDVAEVVAVAVREVNDARSLLRETLTALQDAHDELFRFRRAMQAATQGLAAERAARAAERVPSCA